MACRLKADVKIHTNKDDKANVSILHWLILMGQLRNIAKTMITYGFNPIPDDPDIIQPVMTQYVRLYNLIKSREEQGFKPTPEERELYETITGNIVHEDTIKGTVVKKNRYDASRKTTAMLAISNNTKKIPMGGIEILYICHAAKLAVSEVNGDPKDYAQLIKGNYKGTHGGSVKQPYKTIALREPGNCGSFKFTDFDPHEQIETQLLGDYHRLATTVFGKNVRKAAKGTHIDEEATRLTDHYRDNIKLSQGITISAQNESWTLDVEPFIPTIPPEEGTENVKKIGIAAMRQQAVDDSWVTLGVAYGLMERVTQTKANTQPREEAIGALESYKETVRKQQHLLRFATSKGKIIKGKIEEKDEELDAAVADLAEKTEEEIEIHSPNKKQKKDNKKRLRAATANKNSDAGGKSNNISCDDAISVITMLWPHTDAIAGDTKISCGNEETLNDILNRMAPEGACHALWEDTDVVKVNLIRQQWTIQKVNYEEWEDCVELVEKEKEQQKKKAKK